MFVGVFMRSRCFWASVHSTCFPRVQCSRVGQGSHEPTTTYRCDHDYGRRRRTFNGCMVEHLQIYLLKYELRSVY